jgi:uncharacterized protein (TIGR03067 family)
VPPLIAVLALAVGAPNLKDPPPSLIGEWVAESVTVGGKPWGSESEQWVFAAGGTWAIHNGEKVTGSGGFTWDPKRSPGTIDLAHGSADLPVNLCRYQLNGDTLVLSIGHDAKVRPADVRPGPDVTVWVLKRAKKKD